jgi:tetratricopeptide (TPR) repeat protein
MATGKAATGGASTDVDGVSVRQFQLPPAVEVNVATVGNDLLVTAGKRAMSAAIAAKKQGQSIAKDESLKAALGRTSGDTIKAVIVHAGRAARLAAAFMSERENEEAKPFVGLLDKTVAALIVDHSNDRFGVSLTITGLPNVGPLVTQALMQQAQQQEQRAKLDKAIRSDEPDKALAAIDAELAKKPESVELLRGKFKVLALKTKDREAAIACGASLFEQLKNDAKALNNFAWALLTEKPYGDEYTELALKFSQRSNEVSEFKNWAYLDTLAWAKFKTGDIEEAIALEKKAIDRSSGDGTEELKEALAKFEAALDEAKLAAKGKD